jgi:hypothetical protein
MSMTDHDGPDPAQEGAASTPAPGLGDSIAAAARRSGLGQLAESDASTGAALLGALGGFRGLCETILPGLVFLVLFTFTQNVPVSIISSVAVAVVFTVLRIVGKTPVTQAMAGLIGVGISAILALITGRGEDNFVFGIWVNIAFGAAILISMLLRWPLIGLVAGYLMGGGVAWRRDKRKFRVLQAVTFLWLLLFVVRLLVEVPLYLAHTDAATSALAFARLLTGGPPYALLLLVTWFIVKGQFPQVPDERARGASAG